MIISQTPYRISFFGGGTDYPDWYREHGGRVLSVGIDKFVYIGCRYLPPFFEHRIRLVYSRIELCQKAEELTHPTARETLLFMGVNSDLEIHYDGDLPSRSGLGSSSSFTVGLLRALYAYLGQDISAERLAKESIFIEQTLVGEQVGSQDQVCAAHGGLNKIEFQRNGEISTERVAIEDSRIESLNDSLMLFFTGIERTAEEVAKSYVADIKSKSKQLTRIYDMVDDAVAILRGSGSLDDFGHLLHETWMEKRSLSNKVSSSYIDEIYSTAREAGALGGKLSGAGGGGMILLFVPPKKQHAVRTKLSNLIRVPFRFENTGSRIIFREQRKRYKDSEIWRSNSKVEFVDIKDL